MPDDGGFTATTKQPARLGGATGRGFMPGRSGNPGGRHKEDGRIRKLAMSYAPGAIHVLARLAGLAVDKDGHPLPPARNENSRIAAANSLLDRAVGRPRQEVGVDGDVNGVSWVIRIPAEAVTAEEWLQRYTPEHIRRERLIEEQKAAGKVIDITPSGKVREDVTPEDPAK